VSLLLASVAEYLHTGLGALAELDQVSELDRLGWAGLNPGRLPIVLEPVIAQGALPGSPVVLATLDDPKRAGGDAVAGAVADILLDDDGAELGAEQASGRTDLKAGGIGAVFADVGGHQPADTVALLAGGHATVDGQ
jgi:hypothetical protein